MTPREKLSPTCEENGVAKCAALLERAIKTHDALPGDRKQKLASWPDYPFEQMDAYDSSHEEKPRFRPTPTDVSNMLPVFAWIAWLAKQNNGRRDVGLLFERARRKPWWQIAQKHGRSERQVQRWYDGAVTVIYSRFFAEIQGLKVGRKRNV